MFDFASDHCFCFDFFISDTVLYQFASSNLRNYKVHTSIESLSKSLVKHLEIFVILTINIPI